MNKHIARFNESIEELKNTFQQKSDDYFFTEKELHSYFYHLCVLKDFNLYDYNLIHTEYPTPFKCETLKEDPYIRIANSDSKNQRAHIDLVLINPNFINYVKTIKSETYQRYINGIGGSDGLFSKYIEEHKAVFSSFAQKYNESILLYSLEFKYLRHSYTGEKYSKINLIQDINKLKLLNTFMIGDNLPYSQNIKSIAFVTGKINEKTIESLKNVEKNSNGICELVERK